MFILITPSDAEYIALFSAGEESALYEIPDELRRLIPESHEVVSLCQRAVLKLLQRGLIHIWEDSHVWGPLSKFQAEAIVALESAWQVPRHQDPEIYYLSITRCGRPGIANCGRTKRTGQTWLLGLAGGKLGAQSARREINTAKLTTSGESKVFSYRWRSIDAKEHDN